MIEYRETINIFNKIFIKEWDGEVSDKLEGFIERVPKNKWVLVKVKKTN